MQGIPAEKIDHYMKDMLNKCKRIRPEYLPIVEVADYQGKNSCFLNRLPIIQFLCSEYNKEKKLLNLSIGTPPGNMI